MHASSTDRKPSSFVPVMAAPSAFLVDDDVERGILASPLFWLGGAASVLAWTGIALAVLHWA